MICDARNLTLLHVNNKGAEHPEHLCSLIGSIVIANWSV